MSGGSRNTDFASLEVLVTSFLWSDGCRGATEAPFTRLLRALALHLAEEAVRMQNRAEQHKKELAEAEVLYQETRSALVKSQEQATLLSQRAEGDAAEILQEQGKRKRAEAEAEVLRSKARGPPRSGLVWAAVANLRACPPRCGRAKDLPLMRRPTANRWRSFPSLGAPPEEAAARARAAPGRG